MQVKKKSLKIIMSIEIKLNEKKGEKSQTLVSNYFSVIIIKVWKKNAKSKIQKFLFFTKKVRKIIIDRFLTVKCTKYIKCN